MGQPRPCGEPVSPLEPCGPGGFERLARRGVVVGRRSAHGERRQKPRPDVGRQVARGRSQCRRGQLLRLGVRRQPRGGIRSGQGGMERVVAAAGTLEMQRQEGVRPDVRRPTAASAVRACSRRRSGSGMAA